MINFLLKDQFNTKSLVSHFDSFKSNCWNSKGFMIANLGNEIVLKISKCLSNVIKQSTPNERAKSEIYYHRGHL